jgi:HEPN domain-containing protein
VIGHSAVGLVTSLGEKHPGLTALRDLAAELDLYDIPTRYPNGLVEGTPHQAFTRAQAERAVKAAATILDAVRLALASGTDRPQGRPGSRRGS